MAITERKDELREQVRLVRRCHDAVWTHHTEEERQSARNRRDHEIVIALEMTADLAKYWRNGASQQSIWANLVRMPGSGPVIWLLMGLIAIGVLTGQIRLAHLISFFTG